MKITVEWGNYEEFVVLERAVFSVLHSAGITPEEAEIEVAGDVEGEGKMTVHLQGEFVLMKFDLLPDPVF